MDEWRYEPARDLGMTEAQRLRSLKRESGLVVWLGRHAWWWWVRWMLRLFERVTVEGRENLAAGPPYILVANHASHLDAMVLATALPVKLRSSAFPIAAGDTFFKTPVVSVFAAGALNALPMWRKNCGSHAMEDLRRRLVEEPCGFILFPEGTRSRTGEMGPFRAGIGMIAAGLGVPVIPCHLRGTFEAMPPGKTMPRRAHIVLKIGRAQSFADVPRTHDGWKLIAARLEAAVRELANR